MKTLVILLVILASTLWAQAQGEIYFHTTVPPSRISTNSVPGGPASGVTMPGVLYYYALFYSTTATTVGGNTAPIAGVANGGGYAFDDPNWTHVALGTNFSFGRFLSTVQNTDGSTTVPGVPAGSAASFVVVGWSASMGANLPALKNYYDLVYYDQNDWIGQSAVSGLITLGDGTNSPPANLFGLASPQIPGFVLGETPQFFPNLPRWP
jgi:hypothetical protein